VSLVYHWVAALIGHCLTKIPVVWDTCSTHPTWTQEQPTGKATSSWTSRPLDSTERLLRVVRVEWPWQEQGLTSHHEWLHGESLDDQLQLEAMVVEQQHEEVKRATYMSGHKYLVCFKPFVTLHFLWTFIIGLHSFLWSVFITLFHFVYLSFRSQLTIHRAPVKMKRQQESYCTCSLHIEETTLFYVAGHDGGEDQDL